MNPQKNICIYCASSSDIDRRYFDEATRLAKLIAGKGMGIVCGAGNQGLMGAVADAALQAGGHVTGVIPQFMADKGWGHASLTKTIVTPDIHQRKQRMAQLSDAAIALPGGCGTMEELLEIITWKQLGLFSGKIIILNTAGFYTPLLEMLNRSVDEHFMKASHRHLWHEAANAEEAVSLLTSDAYEQPVEPKR